jgi:hypothetical protein
MFNRGNFALLDGYNLLDTKPLTQAQANVRLKEMLAQKDNTLAGARKRILALEQALKQARQSGGISGAVSSGYVPAVPVQGVDNFGFRSNMGFPLVAKIIAGMVKSRQVAVSLQPNVQIEVVNNSAEVHAYQSIAEFVVAANSAVAGDQTKSVGASASGGTSLTLSGTALSADSFGSFATAGTATSGTPCWAFWAHISSSALNWGRRVIQLDVGPINGAAGPVVQLATPALTLAITAEQAPVDIIVLSVSSGPGRFTMKQGRMGDAFAAATAAGSANGICVRSIGDANSFCSFKSLNARDLGSAVVNPGIVEQAADYDDGVTVYPGISDED